VVDDLKNKKKTLKDFSRFATKLEVSYKQTFDAVHAEPHNETFPSKRQLRVIEFFQLSCRETAVTVMVAWQKNASKVFGNNTR